MNTADQTVARMTRAAIIRARQVAQTAIKAQVRAKGERISDYSARELSDMAQQYLERHPQLLEDAMVGVAMWAREGFFGKAQRRRAWRTPDPLWTQQRVS
jgi:hypothetical protein